MPRPNLKARKIIDSVKYITVATVDDKGQPWNTPVAAFHFDKDYTLYWASYLENQHSKNIRNNSKVFIVIYDSTPENGQPANGVYIKGEATELTNKQEVMQAALVFEGDQYNPSDGRQYLGDYPRRIYKAVPQQIWINTDSKRNGHFIDSREIAHSRGAMGNEISKKATDTKRSKYGDKFFSQNGEMGGLARNLSDKAYMTFREKGSEFASEMGKRSAEKRWGKRDKNE